MARSVSALAGFFRSFRQMGEFCGFAGYLAIASLKLFTDETAAIP